MNAIRGSFELLEDLLTRFIGIPKAQQCRCPRL
jgi:hypothetical protein